MRVNALATVSLSPVDQPSRRKKAAAQQMIKYNDYEPTTASAIGMRGYVACPPHDIERPTQEAVGLRES